MKQHNTSSFVRSIIAGIASLGLIGSAAAQSCPDTRGGSSGGGSSLRSEAASFDRRVEDLHKAFDHALESRLHKCPVTRQIHDGVKDLERLSGHMVSLTKRSTYSSSMKSKSDEISNCLSVIGKLSSKIDTPRYFSDRLSRTKSALGDLKDEIRVASYQRPRESRYSSRGRGHDSRGHSSRGHDSKYDAYREYVSRWFR